MSGPVKDGEANVNYQGRFQIGSQLGRAQDILGVPRISRRQGGCSDDQ
jgi:hypothetical protein